MERVLVCHPKGSRFESRGGSGLRPKSAGIHAGVVQRVVGLNSITYYVSLRIGSMIFKQPNFKDSQVSAFTFTLNGIGLLLEQQWGSPWGSIPVVKASGQLLR